MNKLPPSPSSTLHPPPRVTLSFSTVRRDLEDGPDSPVTQGCLNMYPLDRAADGGDASPIDPNHPGRYPADPRRAALPRAIRASRREQRQETW